MLKINGKTFMNLQEAVQWLLDNNALPFQCSADYQANTEIGLGTIINPSPAKVRIGSLIFFADSKVSTVIGLTENGFICSDQYNNLVDDVVYVSNVALNASGHLIVTLSNGDTIDAGLIKQVSGFSINASQHLIVSYNDSTTTDLGAIFSGNITISGNLTVTGGIAGSVITGDSIIENMSGYTYTKNEVTNLTQEVIYAGVVKNGNKLTIVLAVNLQRTGDISGSKLIASFNVPSAIANKLYPTDISVYNNALAFQVVNSIAENAVPIPLYTLALKYANTIGITLQGDTIASIPTSQKTYLRFEQTFLLSENLAS